MKVVVNELSLNSQYDSKESFLRDLCELMSCRSRFPAFSESLFCSRDLSESMICQSYSFRQAVQERPDLKRIVLGWLSKKGPFVNEISDDSFAFFLKDGEEDITHRGLGQVCSFFNQGLESSALSFPLGGFDSPNINVTELNDSGASNDFSIDNWFDIAGLDNLASKFLADPRTWSDSFSFKKEYLSHVVLMPDCWAPIESQPFSLLAANRLCSILQILEDYVESLDDSGSRTNLSNEIIEKYFVGDKALITDESSKNKNKFKAELTFRDPKNQKTKVFCPWHGKVRSPSQYRIHFEWPIHGKTKIRVFYIGPKITKA